MADENDIQPAPEDATDAPDNGGGQTSARSSFGRKLLKAFGVAGVALVIVAIGGFVAYRMGALDSYVRSQFDAKMERLGISFAAEKFHVTLSPLRLELKNAEFKDKTSGGKLIRVADASVGLTIRNLLALETTRDIEVQSTDVDGAEVWVTFDENGRSNFANLKADNTASNVNFIYTALRFGLKNSVVHYGDTTRKIGGEARNISISAAPLDASVPDDEKRYKVDLRSDDSYFTFDESKIEDVDLRAEAIADRNGADVSGVRLSTPLGESNLKGRIDGWENPKYNFEIESTVDLTRTSTTLPLGTPLTGIGNFTGTLSGEGSKYKVKGEITSESLSASNIYLKGLNVNAAVDGDGSMYEANGKAIAQMLTFEDFKIDFPQMIGLVRGNGTDFKWLGELQAAAAKTPFGTIGRLFLADAVAELKDKKVNAGFGSGRAATFLAKGFSIDDLLTSGGKLSINDGTTNFSVNNASASSFKTKAFELGNLKANNLRIKDVPKRTEVDFDSAKSDNASVDKTKFRNVAATDGRVGYENGTTTFTARTMTADGADLNGARVSGLVAQNFNVRDVPAETIVASDGLRVAKLETDAAILGSLNVAGVRLTVRGGRLEGTSGDIDAGNVLLVKNSGLPEGGALENVKILKPVFMLEPSGRYRASADMSLGGGAVGSVKLGAARAAVTVDNDRVVLENLTADVMDGKLDGRAEIAFNERNRSEIKADFAGLDLAKLLALQGGRVIPVEGQTTGAVDFTFSGTNFRTATGSIKADIDANAGDSERGLIPVAGRVEANAANGLFNIDTARLTTEKSALNASGRFDLNGYASELAIKLDSSDASEIERLVKVTNLSPEFNSLTDDYRAAFAGPLTFAGKLTGSVSDPNIEGSAQLGSLILRDRELGKVSTEIAVTSSGTTLKNGLLTEGDGGQLAFDVTIPSGGTNNIAVKAKLTNINTGNVLAALPIELPETLRGLDADTSGTLDFAGLPNAMTGDAILTAKNGKLRGQTFDDLKTRVVFADNIVNVEEFDAKFADGSLTAGGTYATDTKTFDFKIDGSQIPFERIKPFLSSSTEFPAIGGIVTINAFIKGSLADSKTFVANFKGTGTGITLNGSSFGDVTFEGGTENRRLNANLSLSFEGQQQNASATIDFNDDDLPFRASTSFVNTELAPFIALTREKSSSSVPVTGQVTGTVFVEGNLMALNAKGEREFSTSNVSGAAEFTQLALQIGETPISAVEPVSVRFNTSEIVVQNAKFAGGGSNLVISGTRALVDDGINNFNVNGRINLSILNAASPNAFFAGLADVNVRLTGPNRTARLNGTAEMQNASASAFIGSERITFDRIKGRAIFTSNQVQIDNLTGLLGGGKFTATGGASIGDDLNLQAFRVVLGGNNVTVPLPKNFLTTGDAEIEINGRRGPAGLSTFIAGRINAKRSLYSQNIDLADVIGGRREGSLSQSSGDSSSFGDVNLDLTIEGRNALVVRNNLADLTASLSLRVTGDFDAPQVEGRITADRGTLFYRNDRYETQRGELVFPPNSGGINPIVNLQAETEINGYQIFVKLNGPLTDTENLSAVLTSNPALPSQDVISLITTGSLANTGNGLPTLAQSGINTAAEILTDEIINKPIAKATDKLFGINKFQLDPIISGQRNPGARLTVGRQINRNLLVTYSTNLSEDQNQILAVEYRVSNRLSFVAQYEQRSLTNVTRNRDNFSFEIRLRKRF